MLSKHTGFKRIPLRPKLTMLVLSVSVFALSLACIGFGLYERTSFRSATSNELSAFASTLGANSAASLAFNDQAAAGEILGSLQAEHQILNAILYDNRGRVFAEYRRIDRPESDPQPFLRSDGSYFDCKFCVAVQPSSSAQRKSWNDRDHFRSARTARQNCGVRQNSLTCSLAFSAWLLL